MKIGLYPPQKLIDGGNHTTAARWADILRSLGEQASVLDFDTVETIPDVNIFFNAAKSASRILGLSKQREIETTRIVAVLSGTDMQPELLAKPETQASMDVVDVLVVYEPSAMSKLTPGQLDKTHMIPHSAVQMELPQFAFESGLNIVSVSHIRPEKNLAKYFRCLNDFSDSLDVTFHHIGGTIDKSLAEALQKIASSNPRIWLHGQKGFEQTVSMIRAADLLVHPSLVEGFPNVLVEAVTNQTPIAISRIPVHTATFTGCLPEQHFFDADCGEELISLLQKFVSDSDVRNQFRQACDSIAGKFDITAERNALIQLLRMASETG